MQFKNLHQWLNNGGTLKIEFRNFGEVQVSIGDPGGVAWGDVVIVESSEKAFEWAEDKAKKSIVANREILELYKSGEIEWPSDDILRLPGIGEIKKGEN